VANLKQETDNLHNEIYSTNFKNSIKNEKLLGQYTILEKKKSLFNHYAKESQDKVQEIIKKTEESSKLIPGTKEHTESINKIAELKDKHLYHNSKTLEAIKEFNKETEVLKDIVTEESDKEIKDNIHESFFSLGSVFTTKFESLNGIGQFASSILLLNYVVVSSLTTIVFILYGDYLLKKFNIEVKYPKLAKLILLAKKFRNYNLILSFSFIFVSA
jgi:hypothetical protein